MSGVSVPRGPVARGTAIKIVATVVALAGPWAFCCRVDEGRSRVLQARRRGDGSNVEPVGRRRCRCTATWSRDSIEQAKGTLLYRFKIESRAPRPPAVIAATYNGLVPDTFKDGAEVVAKGTLTADNQLHVVPDGIMAKCPSKYDADKQAPPVKPIAPGPQSRARERAEQLRARPPRPLHVAQAIDGAQPTGAQRRVERGQETDGQRRRGHPQHFRRRDLHRQRPIR